MITQIDTIEKAFRLSQMAKMAFYDLLRHEGDWEGVKNPVEPPRVFLEKLRDDDFRSLFFEVALGREPHVRDSATVKAPAILLDYLQRYLFQSPQEVLFYIRDSLPLGIAGVLRGDHEFDNSVLMDNSGSILTYALFSEIQSIMCGNDQEASPPEEMERLGKLQGYLYNALGMWGNEPEKVVRFFWFTDKDGDPGERRVEFAPKGYELERWDRDSAGPGAPRFTAFYSRATKK